MNCSARSSPAPSAPSLAPALPPLHASHLALPAVFAAAQAAKKEEQLLVTQWTGKDVVNKAECMCVRWSNDGKQVAAGGGDGVVRLYNGDNGNLMSTLFEPKPQQRRSLPSLDDVYPVMAIRFAPKMAGRIRVASSSGNIELIEVKSKIQKSKSVESGNQTLAIDYSPDGTKWASGGTDRIVRIYDESRKEPLHELSGSLGMQTEQRGGANPREATAPSRSASLLTRPPLEPTCAHSRRARPLESHLRRALPSEQPGRGRLERLGWDRNGCALPCCWLATASLAGDPPSTQRASNSEGHHPLVLGEPSSTRRVARRTQTNLARAISPGWDYLTEDAYGRVSQEPFFTLSDLDVRGDALDFDCDSLLVGSWRPAKQLTVTPPPLATHRCPSAARRYPLAPSPPSPSPLAAPPSASATTGPDVRDAFAAALAAAMVCHASAQVWDMRSGREELSIPWNKKSVPKGDAYPVAASAKSRWGSVRDAVRGSCNVYAAQYVARGPHLGAVIAGGTGSKELKVFTRNREAAQPEDAFDAMGSLTIPSGVQGLHVAPDGMRVAVASFDGTVYSVKLPAKQAPPPKTQA